MTTIKTSRRRWIQVFGGIALSTSLLAIRPVMAADGDWDSVVKAANAEGQMLFYSTKADADNAKLLDAFSKHYPKIQAKAVRLVGGAMVARVDQELQAGALAGDVLLHSENQWAAAKAATGAFIIPNGPSVALWKGGEKYYDKGVVVTASEPWVIGYNTNLVKTAPTDWDSLLTDMTFKGQVGLNEVSGLTVAVWYDFVEKKKPGYLEALAKLSPRIYPNSAPLTAGLSSGEIAWAPYSLPSSIDPVKASGAPIAYVVPSSGTWAIVRSSMVFKQAPHPNAAKVFLDFLMSPEGQELLNGNKTGFTVAPGIKLKDPIPVDLAKISIIDYGTYRDADTRKWQNKVDQLFRH